MVSVCMASYNGQKYIKDQITSILDQLNADDELIISDDCSTDDTVGVIKQIQDPRIRLYVNNKFTNHIKNFEFALKQAKGEYIFLSDQDDIWLKNKYADTLKLLEVYDLVASDSVVVDEDLQVIEKSFFKIHHSKKGVLANVVKNNYFGSCMAFRKIILDRALPFPDTIEVSHDFWLGAVAEITGKVLFWAEPTILYRRHRAAFTAHGLRGGMKKSSRSIFTIITGRARIFAELANFYLKYKLKWKKD